MGEAAGLVFPGESEMSQRMRAFDWTSTPMGDPSTWPATLRTAARICVTSRFPMIVWWGPELRFLYNDAYLPLLGSKHPGLGKRGHEVWAEIWHTIGPMLRSVMETGAATWSEDLLLPMDRHGYWEETYWTYSYSPLHDDGVIRGVFAAVSDTTERVVGERRLAALQDLSAQGGTARTQAEACQLVAESLERAAADVPYAAIYLRRPGTDELDLAAVSPGGADTGVAWPVERALRTGHPVLVEEIGRRLPSGGWQTPPTQAVVLPLAGDTDAQTVGVIVLAASAGRVLDAAYRTFLDLVAQQTAALVNSAAAYQAAQRRAEELAELDRAKTAFFSNISHEFRTPLTLIMGPLQELRGQARGDAREQLDIMHRNGLRLGKLVNTLLDFSRIEAGRMQARFEPVDLAVVTGELTSVFRSAIDKAGLEFRVDLARLPEPVHLDRGMWEKVVLNLLSNALKFTFEGSLKVSLRAEDGHAVLRVSDTGIGVPPEEISRLFERFHRIENARGRSNEGSGIGLALVRELVGLHGGSITATSTVDVGTTFTVRLPFGDAHLPDDSLIPASQPGPVEEAADPFVQEALRWLPDSRTRTVAPPSARRVLIADDNADMRAYLSRLLAPSFQVTAVTDGLTALEAIRAHPPDLVISDVMMPRLGGLELVAALRADTRTANLPVLLLSARAGQEASIEGLEAGADDYLVKPFSAAELLARVRGSLQLTRMRNQHASWREALIDSLQEAFFVMDEDGSVIEINSAFSTILGYGQEGLPYPPKHPWWPDATDPDAERLMAQAVAGILGERKGSYLVPATHRDGHRVWGVVSFNEVRDPGTGRRMIVGTVRDVTVERHTARREAAAASLSVRLSQALDLEEAVEAARDELARLWDLAHVTAYTVEDDFPAPLRGLAPLHPVSTPQGVGVTVEHPGGLLGLWIEPRAHRALAPEDLTLLTVLAGRLGQASQRIHTFEQQRETAIALQRAILGPPQLPGGFAVRYEPAARPLEVGGDWYDMVELPDGRIGIMVGDCVGRGLRAATVMGQLRSAGRALLLQSTGPARTLTALDDFAALLPGAECATAFCAILDPRTGRIDYCSAGHPPGIVVPADGAAQYLEGGRSTPLAVRRGQPRPEASYVLPPTALLLLYTDGLVERRRESLDAGLARAAEFAGLGRGDTLQALADRVMTAMRPASGYDDDVALLLYRHPRPLDLTFPAHSDQLAPVRDRLRSWLGVLNLPNQSVQDILVAAGEACANAIEHGHRHTPGESVRLTAHATADEVFVAVSDTGRWIPPSPVANPYRGRGLALIRAFMNHVTIATETTGTTVRMRTRITR